MTGLVILLGGIVLIVSIIGTLDLIGRRRSSKTPHEPRASRG